jgi:hypothetical protein
MYQFRESGLRVNSHSKAKGDKVRPKVRRGRKLSKKLTAIRRSGHQGLGTRCIACDLVAGLCIVQCVLDRRVKRGVHDYVRVVGNMTDESASSFDPVKLVRDIQDYISQAEAYLSDRFRAPDPSLLCGNYIPRNELTPKGSILHAEPRSGGTIAACFWHKDTRNPRIFDAHYFAAMRLLEFAGGRFSYSLNGPANDPDTDFYLRYRPSRRPKAGERIYLMRMIAAVEPNMKTSQLPADHHDYRRCVLDQLPWEEEAGPRPELGREEAKVIALRFFSENSTKAGLTSESFKKLLDSTCDIADEMHEHLYGHLAPKA